MMEFKVKKTSELSQEDIQRILYMFKVVFEHDRSVEVFYNQFAKNQLGYSYHLLMYVNGEIVGSHTYVPTIFVVDGKEKLFVSGADTMIMKGHRDIFNYIDMLNYGRKYLKEIGVAVDYGYPNDLNFEILTKSKMTKVVGHMYTYCLPYRIGGIKKSLKFLNWASKLFCWTWVSLSTLFASSKESKFKFTKALSYNDTRYQRNDGIYNIQDGFVYKVINYEGVRAGFLIDVFEKSPKNFCSAVKYMLKHDGKNFDILLYPGVLPFAVTGLIKIPHKFEPKHFHVVAGVINKDGVDKEALYDLSNWDTNLSNYDLI